MGEDPTEFAGFANAETEYVEAWSLYPDDEPEPRSGRWFGFGAILLAVVGLVAVTVTVVWVSTKDQRSSEKAAPATPSAAAPRLSTAVVPPPPVTVTVTPPPTVTVTPPPAPVPSGAALDQKFIAQLRADGFTITDPVAVAKDGRLTCEKLGSGQSPESMNQEYADAAGVTYGQAMIFTADAMIVYGCRAPAR